jgi:hypothetical protein
VTFDLVSGVGATVIGVIWWLRVLPGLFSGESQALAFFRYDPGPIWWPWGTVLWHAYARMIPFGGTTISVLGPLSLAQLLLPDSIVETDWFVLIPVLALAVCFLGSGLIGLANWPKFLVPLPLRHKPGLIGEIRSRLIDRAQHEARDEPPNA